MGIWSFTGAVLFVAFGQPVVAQVPIQARPCDLVNSRVQVQRDAAAGNESWRLGPAETASRDALSAAAANWKLDLARDLRLEKCEKPREYEGQQFSWCGWSDPAGMQMFRVQITRFGRLRHGKDWRSAPWLLTRGDGIACTVEP
jgi:hypothetical protein